jgi:hypothetical protein
VPESAGIFFLRVDGWAIDPVARGCSTPAVKPVVAPDRPRYRNEAVFRSAERLIASEPKPRAWKRAPRPLFFLGGLASGFAAALLLLWTWRESAPSNARVDAALSNQAGARKATNRPPPVARPALDTPASTAPSPAGTEQIPAPTNPVTEQHPPATPAPRPSPALPSAQRFSPAPRVISLAPPAAWLAVASSTTGLKLRGELLLIGSAPVKVEFQLFLVPARRGSSVEGTVRFIDDPTLPESIRVQGAWFHGAITLSEIHVMPRGAYYKPVVHKFVLELPESDESNEVLGIWSHGGRTGKLVLRTALPL